MSKTPDQLLLDLLAEAGIEVPQDLAKALNALDVERIIVRAGQVSAAALLHGRGSREYRQALGDLQTAVAAGLLRAEASLRTSFGDLARRIASALVTGLLLALWRR